MFNVAPKIHIKNRSEMEALYAANQIVGEVHDALRDFVKPGISTWDLEEKGRELTAKHNVKPAFLGYHGYPAVLCIAVNDEVVHGIPRKDKIIQSGDIVSIDYGVEKDGFIGDSAVTLPVGEISEEDANLCRVTERSLYAAIQAMVDGGRLNDIGGAVEDIVTPHGYGIVREYTGHGVGRQMHEPPHVPNYRTGSPGPRLRVGMVLAIEPMINLGTHKVRTLEDDWTVVTADGRRSAHYEHSVAITEDGPWILSARARGPIMWTADEIYPKNIVNDRN